MRLMEALAMFRRSRLLCAAILIALIGPNIRDVPGGKGERDDLGNDPWEEKEPARARH